MKGEDFWQDLTGQPYSALLVRIDAFDVRELRTYMQKSLVPARQRASQAYSEGRFSDAAKIYEQHATAYAAAGLYEEADTFRRRAAEVRERGRQP